MVKKNDILRLLMMNNDTSLESLLSLCEKSGGTDTGYLRHHFLRFATTKAEFISTWDRGRGTRLLDIGAHWLHQCMLWALDGFTVTAVDLPATFECASVRKLAADHDIQLVINHDLANPEGLRSLPDNSADVILFTEIIEHITFNPIAMWKEIFRIASPGARIIVTTPNYYALHSRAWSWKRFCQGFGGGLDVLNILQTNTYGHHWKEFTLKELIYYFCVMSTDFNVVKAKYLPAFYLNDASNPAANFAKFIEARVPFLRPNLHLEVEIARKDNGIRIEPSW